MEPPNAHVLRGPQALWPSLDVCCTFNDTIITIPATLEVNLLEHHNAYNRGRYISVLEKKSLRRNKTLLMSSNSVNA